MFVIYTSLMFEGFPQHRDPDASFATTRSTETNRAERISEREFFRNDFEIQPALDAVASSRTFARNATTGAPVTFSPEEWLRHLYLVGKTGSGKSHSLKSMALALIEAGETVIYMDPHGDDFKELKDAVPPPRIAKTDVMDVTDTQHPFSFNPLRGVSYDQIPVVAAMQAEGIRDIWADAYSERMHSLVYNGLATLMEHPLTTLDDLPLLFYKFEGDAPHSIQRRQARLRDVKNPVTKRFWEYEFPTYPIDAPVAILSRIGQLLASPHASAILKHRTSAFNLAAAIEDNHVVLINLSKGIVGNTPAAILGSFIISEIRRVAMARAAIPIGQRRPVYLFIDEFQTFATLSLAQILSEARKYCRSASNPDPDRRVTAPSLPALRCAARLQP